MLRIYTRHDRDCPRQADINHRRCLAPAVRQALGGVDPDIPMANIATMDQLLDESVAPQRFRTWLLCLTVPVLFVFFVDQLSDGRGNIG